MSREALLHFKNIKKSFSGNVVLDGVDFEIYPGQVIALAGENGAGKSTLMNILFGMSVIRETGGYEGEIIFEGKTVKVQSPEDAMALGIGMVHQEFMLLPGFTVARNIKLNRENLIPTPISKVAGKSYELLDNHQIVVEAGEALKRLGMEINPETTVDKLPVGHMQFVEIAREIDKKNLKLLVLDEPTAVLTESEAEKFLECIRSVADSGIAVIFISHRLDEVMKLADDVVILRDGQLVFKEKTKNTNKNEIAEMMVGRKLDNVYPKETVPIGDKALEIKDFSQKDLFEDINFHVAKGEIVGFAGLVGAGRTETMRAIFGLDPHDSGQVFINGKEAKIKCPHDSIQQKMVMLSESRRDDGI
ncbi:sugar ABC transporter ATP-binding protein, partial [butyrate-producing bacterium]|nr:sugar ABC transporter ATP-binding protein [butyrate-producing bacterium]